MTQARLSVPAAGGGVDDVNVTTGSTVGTDQIRVLLDDATVTNKKQWLDALDLIKQRIISGPFPLA